MAVVVTVAVAITGTTWPGVAEGSQSHSHTAPRGVRKTRRATTNRVHTTMNLDEWQIRKQSTKFRCASESRMIRDACMQP